MMGFHSLDHMFSLIYSPNCTHIYLISHHSTICSLCSPDCYPLSSVRTYLFVPFIHLLHHLVTQTHTTVHSSTSSLKYPLDPSLTHQSVLVAYFIPQTCQNTYSLDHSLNYSLSIHLDWLQ